MSRSIASARLGTRYRRQLKDRYGNPLTIKVHGPVEPYFRYAEVLRRSRRNSRHPRAGGDQNPEAAVI